MSAPDLQRTNDPVTVTGSLWLHAGGVGWHFITLPHDLADEIRARTAATARPFGTVPVRLPQYASRGQAC